MAESPNVLMLVVATPTGIAVRAEVESLQVPGVQGELGILPGHIPLLSALKPGILRFRSEGRDRYAVVDSGYVEVQAFKVSVLTAGYRSTENIDLEIAKKELSEAEEKLKNWQGVHEGAEHADLADHRLGPGSNYPIGSFLVAFIDTLPRFCFHCSFLGCSRM